MNQITSKDGTSIAFEQSGKGPAVVLVDGALQLWPWRRRLVFREFGNSRCTKRRSSSTIAKRRRLRITRGGSVISLRLIGAALLSSSS
jgi:hypothetical protein